MDARAGPAPGDRRAACPHARGLAPGRGADARRSASPSWSTRGQARAGEVVVLLRAVGDIEVYERALQLHGAAHARRRRRLLGAASRSPTCSPTCARWPTRSTRWRCYCDARLAARGHARCDAPGAARATPALARREACGRPRCARRPRRAAARAPRPPTERGARRASARASPSERAAAARRTDLASCSSGRSSHGYREHVLGAATGASGGSPTSTSCCASPAASRPPRAATCAAFLDHVAYLRGHAERGEPDAPVDGVEPDAVRLMTIHAAKGLEFPVVCVADLGRSAQQPDARPARGRRAPRPAARAPRRRQADARAGLRASCAPSAPRREAEEEDRILYVAMTRARERLLLERRGRLRALARAAPGRRRRSPGSGRLSHPSCPPLAASGEASIASSSRPAQRAVRAASCSAPRAVGRGAAPGRGATGARRRPTHGARGAGRRDRARRACRAASARPSSPLRRRAPAVRRSATPRSASSSAAATATTSNACSACRGPRGREGTGERRGPGGARPRDARAPAARAARLRPPAAPSAEDVGRARPASSACAFGREEREEIAALVGAARCASPLAARIGAADELGREHPFALLARRRASR